MKTLALLTIVLGACTTEPGGSDVPGDLSGQFELATVRTMRGELPIAGVDSDGAGGLWIAYSLSGGDYYANDDVRVVHLDAAGTKDKEFRFKDEFADVHGLAFDGHAVWLNHSGGNQYARKIDAISWYSSVFRQGTGVSVKRNSPNQNASPCKYSAYWPIAGRSK